MTTESTIALKTEIMRFLQMAEGPHDLTEIVRRFGTLADDASIKATLLTLDSEGLLEVTPSWQFCVTVPDCR